MSDPIICFEDPHWYYIPHCIPSPDTIFSVLMEQVHDKVASYMVSSTYSEGKEYPSKRLSCVFSGEQQESVYWDGIPLYKWSDSSVINAIKMYLEKAFNLEFDYCLTHYYRDGTDTITPHSDREAQNSKVVSVSLGATRKFRLRKKGQTKGWDEEFNLCSGDVLIMKGSCQRYYVHWVPVEKKVKEPRLNLTFRSYSNSQVM